MKNHEDMLREAKEGKDIRVARTVDRLDAALSVYVQLDSPSFRLPAVGRFCESRGGPAYNTIRAPKNAHLRDVIVWWRDKYSIESAKERARQQGAERRQTKDLALIAKIDDPAIRAVMRQIEAERRAYKRQVSILKKEITRRETYLHPPHGAGGTAPLLEPTVRDRLQLLPIETEALAESISAERAGRNGWTLGQLGDIRDEFSGTELLPAGFVHALRKILKFIGE